MNNQLKTLIKRTIPLRARNRIRKLLNSCGGFLMNQKGWNRTEIAAKYLSGQGIEIGALHSPLTLPRGASVKYVDRMDTSELRRQYPELAELDLVHVDIIDNGETLNNVSHSSLDFVIANHFIEHCQNPLLTLKNMFRVLKQGGILYMAVPDKRYTFDIDRPTTSIEHLLNDFSQGSDGTKRQHFVEWVKYVDKIADGEESEKRINELIDMDYSIHFHAWTQREMFEFVLALNRNVGIQFDVEFFVKNDVECIFLLRKSN